MAEERALFLAWLGVLSQRGVGEQSLEILQGLLTLYPRRVPICIIYIYIYFESYHHYSAQTLSHPSLGRSHLKNFLFLNLKPKDAEPSLLIEQLSLSGALPPAGGPYFQSPRVQVHSTLGQQSSKLVT